MKLLPRALVALLLPACAPSSIPEDQSWEQFKAAAFHVYEDDGARHEFYLIEGDIPVSLEKLRHKYDGIAQTARGATANLVDDALDVWHGEEHHLSYCVSDAFDDVDPFDEDLHARAVRDMLQATSAWEAAADVRFIYLPEHDDDCRNTNSNVAFAVRPYDEPGVSGCAFFPSGEGCVPRTVLLNYPHIDAGDPVSIFIDSVGVVRHELGHVLGFRHEHTRGPCPELDPDYVGVTAFDLRSVMTYATCSDDSAADHRLTTMDRQGARRIYGAPHVVYDHRFARSDLDGDLRTDLALAGGRVWSTIPVAFGLSTSTFNVTNSASSGFATAANQPGVQVVKGDFNGDGKTDLALVGDLDATTIPTARSNGDGSFNVITPSASTFTALAKADNARPIAGDFNGDGRSDIALLGELGRTTIPIAFAQANGTYTVTNVASATFTGFADDANVKMITGYFNSDAYQDIALVGGSGWTTIPTAFSNGDGSFTTTSPTVNNFPAWAATEGVDVVAGDFDSDGDTDIALAGALGWSTIPVARSNGDGTYNVGNNSASTFAGAAAAFGAEAFTGDFNFDLRSDIVIAGGLNATTIPVAFFSSGGSFSTTNTTVSNFPGWATTGAAVIAGDFNGDGKSDLALTGAPGWTTIPLARSNGSGGFTVSNPAVTGFGDWASTSGVWIK